MLEATLEEASFDIKYSKTAHRGEWDRPPVRGLLAAQFHVERPKRLAHPCMGTVTPRPAVLPLRHDAAWKAPFPAG